MTDAARAQVLAMLADLASPHSSTRLRLWLDHLRARSSVDPAELPGPPPRGAASRPDAWERKLQRASSRIDELERDSNARAMFGDPVAPLDLSSLVSLGLSDPPDQGIHLPPTADPWRRELELRTATFRRARADASRRRACMAIRGLRPPAVGPTEEPWGLEDERIELAPEELLRALEGVPGAAALLEQGEPIPYTDAVGRALEAAARDKGMRPAPRYWCRSRGQLQRFAAVEACGTAAVSTHCVACGVTHEAAAHCCVGRVCVPCRARAKRKRTRRFEAGQRRELEQVKRAQLLRGRHRWAERHLTLTVPHDAGTRLGDEHDGPMSVVIDRVRLLRRAWRLFSIRLQKWARAVRKRDGISVPWYRAFEWTAGADGYGHPHFHVWILCPMLWEADVARWWAQALTAAGRPIGASEVIVSVRGFTGRGRSDAIRREVGKGDLPELGAAGRDLLGYIEGWSLVDVDRHGDPLDPDVAAALYAALEAARLVQTSRGLLERARRGCMACGELRTVRTTVDRRPREVRAAHGLRARGGADPPC